MGGDLAPSLGGERKEISRTGFSNDLLLGKIPTLTPRISDDFFSYFSHQLYFSILCVFCLSLVVWNLIYTHRLYITFFFTKTEKFLLGPSMKYVTLFLADFWPPLPVTLCHTSRNPSKKRHTSWPPIFRRPSTQILEKSPLYKFYLNCSRRFLSGVLSGLVFVRCPSVTIHLLQQKVKHHFNFMFHLYDKFFYKRDVTCSWPLSLSQTVTPSRIPPPSSVMYFRDGPLETLFDSFRTLHHIL